MAEPKELNWFPDQCISQAEYEESFSTDLLVRGEATSHYIHYLDQIHKVYPGIKLIIAVRNPIKQFVSALKHWKTIDGQVFDIETIIDDSSSWQLSSCYYKKILMRVAEFGFPYYLVNFNQLVNDQQTVWDGIADFLGVSHWNAPYYIHANSSKPDDIVLTKEQIAKFNYWCFSSVRFLKENHGIDFTVDLL